jgi:hypothetical protein
MKTVMKPQAKQKNKQEITEITRSQKERKRFVYGTYL